MRAPAIVTNFEAVVTVHQRRRNFFLFLNDMHSFTPAPVSSIGLHPSLGASTLVPFVIHAAVLMWRSGCLGTSRVQSQFLSRVALVYRSSVFTAFTAPPTHSCSLFSNDEFLDLSHEFLILRTLRVHLLSLLSDALQAPFRKRERGCCGQADGQRTNGCVERHCAWGRRSLGTCASGLCASIFVVYFIKPDGCDNFILIDPKRFHFASQPLSVFSVSASGSHRTCIVHTWTW